MKKLKDLIESAKKQRTMKLAVCASDDFHVLEAVKEAVEKEIVIPILVGNIEKTKEIAKEIKFDISKFEQISSQSLEETAKISVKLVRDEKADFLMKGLIDTSVLLREVLNKEYGLRTDSLLSHIMIYEIPSYHKLVISTDGGMNIAPDLENKAKILRNAVQAAKAIGIKNPKVACIAAKEKVSEKMPATVDARELQNMSNRGEFGESVVTEGPLAIDLAFSKEAAEIKGFESEIAGDVDILLHPSIESGNVSGKILTYLAGAKSSGVVMGATKPIVLTSRADDFETKLYSIALGSTIASKI